MPIPSNMAFQQLDEPEQLLMEIFDVDAKNHSDVQTFFLYQSRKTR